MNVPFLRMDLENVHLQRKLRKSLWIAISKKKHHSPQGFLRLDPPKTHRAPAARWHNGPIQRRNGWNMATYQQESFEVPTAWWVAIYIYIYVYILYIRFVWKQPFELSNMFSFCLGFWQNHSNLTLSTNHQQLTEALTELCFYPFTN